MFRLSSKRYVAHRAGILCAIFVFVFGRIGRSDSGDRTSESPGTGALLDAPGLTAKIDELITARWSNENVEPAPPADDAEFMRRVYLDLAGKIPPVSEVRSFLDDRAPDKRLRLVERLLDSPTYPKHFSNVWRKVLLPDATGNLPAQFLAPGFEAWLRKRLSENAGFDRMAREILTVSSGAGAQQEFNPFEQQSDPTPVAFYLANELKPENLAANSSRVFLGLKLECAQCHNHPFARWSREQFWSYAAFFSGVQQSRQGGFAIRDEPKRQGLSIPGTDKVLPPRFLDDTEPQWKENVSVRATLAHWLASSENPWFARAAVNRLWNHLFGIGLVEPVDELDDSNPASHPELLTELAIQFGAHEFDLKFLIRAVTASRAYQLTSTPTHASQEAPHLFARMAARGLSPEQLFDSLVQATGFQEQLRANPQRFGPFGGSVLRAEFLAKFAQQNDRRTESQTTILQALSLMNGKIMADATSLDRSEALAAVADSPFLDTAERIETLYLATLTRRPRTDETARLVEHVDSGGARKNSKSALADVFWALLNSGEFMLNH